MSKILNKKTIEKAEVLDKTYRIYDASMRGLYIAIRANGLRVFYYRSRKYGMDRHIKLGVYPFMSIHDAKKEVLRLSDELTDYDFNRLFPLWVAYKEKSCKPSSFIVYQSIFKRIHAIFYGSQLIHKGIFYTQKIKASKEKESIQIKIFQALNDMFKYGCSIGVMSSNPLEQIQLSVAFTPQKHTPRTSIEKKEISCFFQSLFEHNKNIYENCFIVLIALNLLRKNEILKLKWSDIDFKNKQVTIPAERMKSKRVYIFPLCPLSLEILQLLHTNHVSKKGLIFHLKYKNHIIQKTISFEKFTLHGFRHLGSTILHDEGFTHEVIETQLSHVTGSTVSRIYNTSQLLSQRRKMITWYEEFMLQQYDFMSEIRTYFT